MLATVRSTPNGELLQQIPGKQGTRLNNDFAFRRVNLFTMAA
jgi:hypothetical protein